MSKKVLIILPIAIAAGMVQPIMVNAATVEWLYSDNTEKCITVESRYVDYEKDYVFESEAACEIEAEAQRDRIKDYRYVYTDSTNGCLNSAPGFFNGETPYDTKAECLNNAPITQDDKDRINEWDRRSAISDELHDKYHGQEFPTYDLETNRCLNFQVPFDEPREWIHEQYWEADFLPYFDSREECEVNIVTEGRYITKYEDGYRVRGHILNGKFVEADRIKYSMDDVRALHPSVAEPTQSMIDSFEYMRSAMDDSRRLLFENLRVGGIKEERDMTYPHEKITRAQMASLVVKSLHLKPMTSGDGFPDVSADSINFSDIQTLKNLGVVQGKSDGGYHPEDNVTRGEMVSMIVRTMGELGIDIQLLDRELEMNYSFPDVEESKHKSNIVRLANLKYDDTSKRVVNGYGDGQFRPDNYIEIQEAAIIGYHGRTALGRWLREIGSDDYSKYYV